MHFFGTHTCLCRLQNCPSADFGVFKYVWAVTQKVWNKAANGVWGSRVLLLRHARTHGPSTQRRKCIYNLSRFELHSCCILVSIKDRPVSNFWVLRFRSRVLRFRVLGASFSSLGASFSSFGCFVFEIWVLRPSVFVFECFVFETTIDRHRLKYMILDLLVFCLLSATTYGQVILFQVVLTWTLSGLAIILSFSFIFPLCSSSFYQREPCKQA